MNCARIFDLFCLWQTISSHTRWEWAWHWKLVINGVFAQLRYLFNLFKTGRKNRHETAAFKQAGRQASRHTNLFGMVKSHVNRVPLLIPFRCWAFYRLLEHFFVHTSAWQLRFFIVAHTLAFKSMIFHWKTPLNYNLIDIELKWFQPSGVKKRTENSQRNLSSDLVSMH